MCDDKSDDHTETEILGRNLSDEDSKPCSVTPIKPPVLPSSVPSKDENDSRDPLKNESTDSSNTKEVLVDE